MSTFIHNAVRFIPYLMVMMILTYISITLIFDGMGSRVWVSLVLIIMIGLIVTRRRHVRLARERRWMSMVDRSGASGLTAYVPPAERPAFQVMFHDGRPVDVFSCNPITLDKV